MNAPDRRVVAYEFAGFRLEPQRRTLTRADGTAVLLTGKVFDALLYLVEHAGELVARDALTKALWPRTIVEENNLNVTISALRRALGGDASGQRHVVTIAGRGYQFVADVRAVEQSTPDDTAARKDAADSVAAQAQTVDRSEEHTSELQSLRHLVCRLLLEKKKDKQQTKTNK